MLKIGHRGAMGYEPENTLRSFKRALVMGVDMVELDVHVCQSGELMVMHDETINRTTNGKGLISNFNLQELKKFDAGNGEQIPTLNEVLDLINHQVPVNIELKGENTAEPVSNLINTYIQNHNWQLDDFLFSSFNHQELFKLKELLPKSKIGVLIDGKTNGWPEFAYNHQAYSINFGSRYVNLEAVQEAHKLGLKVLVYTVNEPEEIAKMKTWGVDGIFTNFPDRA